MGSIPDYESAIQIISEQDERILALLESQLHELLWGWRQK